MKSEMRRFEGMVRSARWEDVEGSAERAAAWARDHQPWIERVRLGQWEGLRRQVEQAGNWAEFVRAIEEWLTYPDKPKDEQPRVRRAWNLPGEGAGHASLKESLLAALEDASLPAATAARQRLDRWMEPRLTKAEIDAVDQWIRVRQARVFLEYLVLAVRQMRKECDEYAGI